MRIEYLAVTVTLFIAAFIMYGFVGIMGDTFTFQNKVYQFLGFGILAGYGFTSLLCGTIIFSRFIAKKNLSFKILCAAFFILSFGAIVFIGVFGQIPYAIYNIVKIFNKPCNSKGEL